MALPQRGRRPAVADRVTEAYPARGDTGVEMPLTRVSSRRAVLPIDGPVEHSDHANAVPLSVDALLERAVELNASDVHITAGSRPAVRVHGHIELLDEYPELDPDTTRELIYRITTTEQQKQLELKRQLDFAHGIRGLARFRVNAYYQREAIAAAFRLIPTDIRSLEDLGLPASLHEFTGKPRGLVLFTGPTGSGKSTSLAALIDEINRIRTDHIITIEDPIEFLHEHKRCIVNQREIGWDAISFAEALRGALRQDPDVILLGEMRDLETIATALTAAETGHLVFATLHTQSAPSTIDRIIDVFPASQQDQVRMQLANTLQGIVTQTLLPKADGTGRVVALEILFLDDAIRNLIRQGKIEQVYSYMQTGTRRGMQTMEQSLTELLQKRLVNVTDAIGRSSRPEALVAALERAGIPIPAMTTDGAPASPSLGGGLRVAGS
jgi:twitching motility protein PilT